MKVTHVISDTNVGGAGVLVGALVKSLSSVSCEVVLPRGSALIPRLRECGANIKEFDMGRDKSFSPRDIPRFISYFKRSRPDVVHTHAALSARIAARLAGCPACISTRHCSTPNPRRARAANIALYNYCTTMTVSTADFATKNLICEGIPRERIVTIKNAVAELPRTSESERRKLRSELNIPEDRYILGSAARLETVKGHDILLRAAARLITLGYKIHLLILGDGSERENLMLLASRLGILDYTTFTGYVDSPAKYQNLFYINVNSSRGTETSCLATSECMSLGIPSCVSNFGGNTEQITDGENGLIFISDSSFSLAERLAVMLSDKSLYKKLSDGARRRYLRDFSLPRMCRDYDSFYHSLKYIDKGRRL